MIISESMLSIIWKTFLLVLPISSFTLLSKVLGNTNVAPLALIPMVVILLLWWLPNFFKDGRKLPYQFRPLMLFFFVGVLSTLLISFRNVPSFQDVSQYSSILEVIASFGMGVGFYLITIYIVKNEDRLHTTLLWISIAGIVLMAYSWFQVGIWYLFDRYPEWLYNVQHFFSSNGMLFPRRATGLAFEPSWLAHELNIIYLPIWLGLSIKKISVFKRKLFNKFRMEPVLFSLSLVTLFLSFSRIGWITTFCLLTFVILRQIDRKIKNLSDKSSNSGQQKAKGLLFRALIWIVLILILFGVLFLAGFILTKLDPRMSDFFDLQTLSDRGFMRWASQLVFLERIMYWIAGYRVFQRFPLLGAGFGMPGYFFQSTVPVYGSQLLDINDFMLKLSFLPNTKNLWVRILSETGIIGFALFSSWLFYHWQNAMELERSDKSGLSQAMGLIGKLILIAFIIEGFSLDTFGLPYYWVGFGLIVASWRAKYGSQASKPKHKLD